jgi:transketolase
VEHLWALRAIPNLNVFRPCDAVETAECWALALQSEKTPSILALTRQKLRPARLTYAAQNLSAQGAYEIAASGKKAKAVIFASGSEVEIALDAKALLDQSGTPTRVVSVPSVELFDRQSKAYREKVLGTERIRIAIEAGIRLGWDRFIGLDGIFIGMRSFGASGPGEKVYQHFGITADAVAKAVKAAR